MASRRFKLFMEVQGDFRKFQRLSEGFRRVQEKFMGAQRFFRNSSESSGRAFQWFQGIQWGFLWDYDRDWFL